MGESILKTTLYGWNSLGERLEISEQTRPVTISAWEQRDLQPIDVQLPGWSGLVICAFQLLDKDNELLHSNFKAYRLEDGDNDEIAVTFAPNSFSDQSWSLKQWEILDGLKVNGAGHGFFDFEIALPELDDASFTKATLLAELSAKPLNGKDKEQQEKAGSDYMRGRGMHDPSQNPNAYPMTDTFANPSQVVISINGKQATTIDLEDDPADHRGILSWHAQPQDRKLREAGTYGYLVKVPFDESMISEMKQNGKVSVRFEVQEENAGGLAIYGKDFGRYPLDPTILFE